MQASRTAAALGLIGAISLSVALAFGPQHAKKPVKIQVPNYASVAPIFKKNCVGCHMGAHPKHGLDLTTYANILKGDHEGKVIVPHKPADSRLSKAIHRSPGAAAMPPGATLPAADVAKVDAWIKFGAKEK